MKPKLILILIISCSLLTVQASNKDVISKKVNKQDVKNLIWMDAQTGQTLFTDEDIICFDWDKQVFHLKRDATIDFMTWMVPHKFQYRKLIVKDNIGIIYEGQWVSGASSMSFLGPVYSWSNPFFTINNGYPNRNTGISSKDDLRFNDRIKNFLGKTGKLSTIDLDRQYPMLTIDIIDQSWLGCGEDLKVRIEYISNTFIFNGEPRIHIYFAGGEKVLNKINDISIEIKLTADFGKYRSDVNIGNIPSKVISDGLYVWKFKPWIPKPGSLKIPMPGTSKVSVSLLFNNITKNGFETIYRLDFPEVDVPLNVPVDFLLEERDKEK